MPRKHIYTKCSNSSKGCGDDRQYVHPVKEENPSCYCSNKGRNNVGGKQHRIRWSLNEATQFWARSIDTILHSFMTAKEAIILAHNIYRQSNSSPRGYRDVTVLSTSSPPVKHRLKQVSIASTRTEMKDESQTGSFLRRKESFALIQLPT